jgi:hypothetical protein
MHANRVERNFCIATRVFGKSYASLWKKMRESLEKDAEVFAKRYGSLCKKTREDLT